MVITAPGYLWLAVLGAGLLFLPLRHVAGLVILASVFQASSVINVAGKGLSPFVLAELVFIVRGLMSLRRVDIPVWSLLLFLFVLYCAYTVFFFPEFFSGTKVLVPDEGIDASVLAGGRALSRTVSQFAQLVYLSCNALTLLLFYLHRYRLGGVYVFTVFNLAMMLVVTVGIWEFLAGMTGLYFPYAVLYNNPGYEQAARALALGVDRLNSTFVEPSLAGGVLAATFWMMLRSGFPVRSAFSLLALVMTMSGTGMVAATAGLLASLKKPQLFMWMLLGGVVSISILYLAGFSSYFESFVLDKLASHSGQVRIQSDLFSLNLVVDTYGLGSGLGSHRPSSLWAYVLGNAGVIGVVLYSLFVLVVMLEPAPGTAVVVRGKRFDAMRFYVLVLLAAQLAGIPDLNFSPFWAALCVLVVVAINSPEDMRAMRLIHRSCS